MARTVLVFELRASSGHAMLATLADERITLTEAHRFNNAPVQRSGTLY